MAVLAGRSTRSLVVMRSRARYPRAVNPNRDSGGGYVWDEVLEYRVWCHPASGESDYYYAFATYPKALAFSQETPGAEEPLVLIRQRQHINEPEPGRYIHVKKPRLTEWPVEFLSRPRRDRYTIPNFLSPTAPDNRLDILRGVAKGQRRARGKA